MSQEKRVSYTSKNTYTTLNELTGTTRNFWFVFHGMGYLSRYFAKYFAKLDPAENYIVAPQAPSKYYQGPDYKHVGASWLTREDTVEETRNVLSYVNAVYNSEKPQGNVRFIVMGYSQGVSIAARWLAHNKISCDHLLLLSGGIPKELGPQDFAHFGTKTAVTYAYGNKDPFITDSRIDEETERATRLFGSDVQVLEFEGVHEVNTDLLLKIGG